MTEQNNKAKYIVPALFLAALAGRAFGEPAPKYKISTTPDNNGSCEVNFYDSNEKFEGTDLSVWAFDEKCDGTINQYEDSLPTIIKFNMQSAYTRHREELKHKKPLAKKQTHAYNSKHR